LPASRRLLAAQGDTAQAVAALKEAMGRRSPELAAETADAAARLVAEEQKKSQAGERQKGMSEAPGNIHETLRERAQRGGIEALRQEDPGYMLRTEKLLPELLQDRRVQAEMDAIRQEPGNEHLTKDDVALANEWFRRKLEKLTPAELAKLESGEGKATWEGILWGQLKDSVQLQMQEAGAKTLSDTEIQKLAVMVPQAQQEGAASNGSATVAAQPTMPQQTLQGQRPAGAPGAHAAVHTAPSAGPPAMAANAAPPSASPGSAVAGSSPVTPGVASHLRPAIPVATLPPTVPPKAPAASSSAKHGTPDPVVAPAPLTPQVPPPLPKGAPAGITVADFERLLKITHAEKHLRPDPETYTSPEYRAWHRGAFAKGAYRIMPLERLIRRGPVREDGTTFVLTEEQALAHLKNSGGDIRLLEQSIKVPPGTLKEPLVLVYFPDPGKHNLRIPSGREDGANESWIPGGA